MKTLSKFRSFIFYFTATAATLIMGVLFLPAFFSRRLSMGIARLWIKVILGLLKVICKIDFKVVGKENIKNGAFILASKHQSAMETLIITLIVQNPIFILKKSLFFIPIIGLALKSSRAIYIDRSNGRDAILHIRKKLQEISKKDTPIIFPEGTRSYAGHPTERYYSGIAVIYEALHWPIVPVAVNTGMFWPKRGHMKTGIATIKILPQIFPSKKYDRKQFLKQLNEVIESNSIELYKNTLSEYSNINGVTKKWK